VVLSVFPVLAIVGAAVAAGLVNALAGAGTLIAFPILTMLGVPPVVANVTLTVALSPGYLGGALAQRQLLSGQRKRLLTLIPVSIVGGVAGGVSVVTLAILGLTIKESLTRLNAVKQALSFAMNIPAAIFFVFSGQVDWAVAAIMAVGALAGGMLGGKLANRISPAVLRTVTR